MSMFTPPGVGGRTRKRRRVSPLRVGVALVTLAAVAGASWLAWSASADGDRRSDTRATPSCPTPSPAPAAVPAGQIKVNVYNATDRRGLAARVAGELKRRGFRIGKVDNDPLGRTVTAAAEVRHSSAGARAARTVTAQVGDVVAVPDERQNATVDLVLGAGFVRLQAPQQVAAALSPTPAPAPSGC